MKDYGKAVLNGLVNRYERSSLSRGTNRVRVTIAYPVTKKNLPEYFDETSTVYMDIHEQLESLEAKGWISLVWQGGHEGHILEKCVLNPEFLPEVYHFLGRSPRKDKEGDFLALCRSLRQELIEVHPDRENQSAGRTVGRFLDFIEGRLRRDESIAQYASLDDPESFRSLCRLVSGILSNKEECFLREFSIRVFHDSKAAEKEIGKACRIIRDFSGDDSLKDLGEDGLLAEFMIYRNPSWIMMKGCGRFCVSPSENGETTVIELENIPGGLALTDESVPLVRWIRSERKMAVLTIENLTTFHRWHRAEFEGRPLICLYLGGYANHIRRAFLRKIHEAYPDARYLHFGDIDCGGFRIWHHLAISTGIPFEPFLMGPDILMRYLPECRELTASDRKTLSRMLSDPAYEEVRPSLLAMRGTGRKLEQECVSLSDEDG